MFHWIPAVTAMATFGWSYYAYVFVFCGKYVKEQALHVVFIMVYHLLLFFCLWPYAMTTFTSPAPVPQSFHFSTDERRALESCANSPTRKTAVLEAMADKRGVLTRSSGGLVAHCDRCQCIKPDRCHHCSKCQRCITKMDHHCPWFNNCVSFRTYKYFLLTLFYIVVLGAYASLSTSFYLWHSNPRRSLLELSLHIPFLVIVGRSGGDCDGSLPRHPPRVRRPQSQHDRVYAGPRIQGGWRFFRSGCSSELRGGQYACKIQRRAKSVLWTYSPGIK
ncbi:hypothetical protein HPB48_007497 [Haemaphysalis longicornis]|uniref:Palmitoyltransferase n=1 Tax=Haemaphysalis longicornis TaxID=44386 RepID=A0A9J6GED6_HAELO|nr:hypothetical protein HPB48_007497 [Haemaphysalis longicornis]